MITFDSPAGPRLRVTLEKVTAVTRMASGNMRGQKARCFAMKNVHGL